MQNDSCNSRNLHQMEHPECISRIKELELSDIVEINCRNDVGKSIPIVGFVSRVYDGSGKLYLKNTHPIYNSGTEGERSYSIKSIEYVRKLSPLGKRGVPAKILC